MSARPSAAAAPASSISWRDPKRYLWPLGLLVPTLPFIALGLVEADRPRGVLVVSGRSSSSGSMPILDTARRQGRGEPAGLGDQVASRRTASTAGAPTSSCRCSTARSSVACALWSSGRAVDARVARPGDHGRLRRRHRDQHRPRARPQAQAGRALAVEDRARADAATATSSSSTTAATTCASPRRRIRPARASARAFWEFLPRSVVGSADVRLGAREGAPRRAWAEARGRSTTTSSTPGR